MIGFIIGKTLDVEKQLIWDGPLLCVNVNEKARLFCSAKAVVDNHRYAETVLRDREPIDPMLTVEYEKSLVRSLKLEGFPLSNDF